MDSVVVFVFRIFVMSDFTSKIVPVWCQLKDGGGEKMDCHLYEAYSPEKKSLPRRIASAKFSEE